MSRFNELSELLSRSGLWGCASDHFRSELSAQVIAGKYDKGKIIFSYNDPATRFYVVVSGWVKLYRETLEGEQSVIDIVSRAHIFGETAIFNDNTYSFSAEVVEDAEVFSLPLGLLQSEIYANSKMAVAMLAHMARYVDASDKEIEHKNLQSAPQRIGCFLLHLACEKTEDGKVVIRLPYDKTLIASRLGMQPETFSRALAKLKSVTGLTVHGSSITLRNLESLSSYVCSGCSDQFPCRDKDRNTVGGL